MSMSESREAEVLQNLLPQYEAEGFDVYVNPSPSILPPFLQSYRPDAVALRDDKKIAIEIVSSSQSSGQKLQRLQSLFSAHRDWELRVIYISSLSGGNTIEVASQNAIEDAVRRVAALERDGHYLPALIMAWSALEAAGRALLPTQFRRPQTPARLIEVLASQGYLTPEEADLLRPLISLRNAAVHGSADSAVSKDQIGQFLGILRGLVSHVDSDTPRIS